MSAEDFVRVREGDLFEVTCGETRFRSRALLREGTSHPYLVAKIGSYLIPIRVLRDHNFTFEIVEAAGELVPTVPGIYTDKQGDVWRISPLIRAGIRFLSAWDADEAYLDHISANAADYAPFTLLTPEVSA